MALPGASPGQKCSRQQSWRQHHMSSQSLFERSFHQVLGDQNTFWTLSATYPDAATHLNSTSTTSLM